MSLRLIVCLLIAGVTLSAQQPPAPPSDQPSAARFGTATAGVVVDVVVRDGQGRPVTNLTKDDFEVFEDGFEQTVVGFEPYTAADAPLTVAAAAAAAGLPASAGSSPAKRLADGPPVIALAWDRLSPEARALAHRAAQRLVETKGPGELVGVFLTDLTLAIIQPYTTDPTKLMAAVEDLATRATSQQGRESSPVDTLVGRAQIPLTASASESGYSLEGFPQYKPERAPAPGAGDRPEVAVVTDIVTMLLRMEQSYVQFLYEAQGRASLLGLLSLVDSLGQLPGRKTVLYFCEGLTIPESQQARFRKIIETANRNNVSVYTFDAAGLRVHSAQQQTAREIQELTFVARGLPQSRSSKWTEELETNERLLKMDPAVSLSILARQTGGLLTDNTNALDRAIEAINDDRRHHYLLSYVSTNAAMDGSYRQIVVQVRQPGVQVRARRGYRAATSVAATPVLDYEEAPLAALSVDPAPTPFPVALRAMHTPMPGRPGLVSVFAAFNARSLTLGRNDDGTEFVVGATVVARVVNEHRDELARASQQFEIRGAASERDSIRQRPVLFFKTADLPPGRHLVEVAAHDPMAGQSAVTRTPVVVAAPTRSWLAGDLIVVARVEPIAPETPGASTHPLVSGGQLFTPEPATPASRTPRDTVSFVVPVITFDRNLARAPARVELRRGENVAARAVVTIPPPRPDGRLLFAGSLPLAGVSPGEYELRVTIDDTTRTATLRVTP